MYSCLILLFFFLLGSISQIDALSSGNTYILRFNTYGSPFIGSKINVIDLDNNPNPSCLSGGCSSVVPPKPGSNIPTVYLPKPPKNLEDDCKCNITLAETPLESDKVELVPSTAPVPKQITAPSSNSTANEKKESTCSPVSTNEQDAAFMRVALVSNTNVPTPTPANKDVIAPPKYVYAYVERDGKVCLCKLTERDLNLPTNTWLIQKPDASPPSDLDCLKEPYIIYDGDATHRMVVKPDSQGVLKLVLEPAIPLKPNETPAINNPNGSTLVTFQPILEVK